jgi:steroid delta-isomerase-like uncharacterized protein
MSSEQNKAIVLQCYKAFDQGNLEQAKELFALNIVVDSLGPVIHGRDGFFKYMQIIRSTFPDSYHIFEDVIAEGDKVVTRGTFTGTHCSEYLGIPPTGKHVTISVAHIDRLRDGQVIEHWGLSDALSMTQQLRGENQ